MKFLVKEVPKDVIQSFGEKIFVNVPMNELERQVKTEHLLIDILKYMYYT